MKCSEASGTHDFVSPPPLITLKEGTGTTDPSRVSTVDLSISASSQTSIPNKLCVMISLLLTTRPSRCPVQKFALVSITHLQDQVDASGNSAPHGGAVRHLVSSETDLHSQLACERSRRWGITHPLLRCHVWMTVHPCVDLLLVGSFSLATEVSLITSRVRSSASDAITVKLLQHIGQQSHSLFFSKDLQGDRATSERGWPVIEIDLQRLRQ